MLPKMLPTPARVAVTPVSSTAERIRQRIIQVDFSAKPAFLTKLLNGEPIAARETLLLSGKLLHSKG